MYLSHSHKHEFHTYSEVRSLHMSKALPTHELLHTIITTMRGPWPHKSTHNQSQALPHSHHCPTLHAHTLTMGHSRAGGPAMQFHHTKTHTSPYPVRERKEWQRWQEKNCNPQGGTEEKGWNTKVGVQRESVWGCGDNTLGRERLTVGQLRLCFCKPLSPELNQSLAKPLSCSCLKCVWDYIQHPLAD